MRKEPSVVLFSDKAKVEKQIMALEWQIKQPGEDEKKQKDTWRDITEAERTSCTDVAALDCGGTMNDRHLYQAKRLDNGEWVEGYCVLCRGYHYILPVYDIDHGFDEWYAEWAEIDPAIRCQCTGLKDKNDNIQGDAGRSYAAVVLGRSRRIRKYAAPAGAVTTTRLLLR